MVSDSFSFIQELLNLKFDSNLLIMASFDITSLFTNIPVNKTIDIVINHLFLNTTHYHGFSCKHFKKLLHFSVKECYFLFNGSLYEQIDGVAMGSLLGLLFADIFLSFHKRSWLNNCPPQFDPLYYQCYFDDCFFYLILQIISFYFLISSIIDIPILNLLLKLNPPNCFLF